MKTQISVCSFDANGMKTYSCRGGFTTDLAGPATSGSEEFARLLPKNQAFVVKTSIKPIVLIK